MTINSTRRSLLKAAPFAALALAIPNIAPAATYFFSDRTEWDRALAQFRAVEREHDELYRVHEQAEEAAHALVPERPDQFIDEYRLGIGMDRQQIGMRLYMYQGMNKQELDIPRITEEFDAFQQRVLAARRRCSTEETWAACQDYQPAFQQARDALMAVASPDTKALLIKIEIAAMSLDCDHAEAMRVDAQRLLGIEA